MKLLEKFSQFEGFETDWKRLILQGTIILLVGAFLALASIVNPDAVVLSARGFSWLPVAGVFYILLGLIECMDALFAKQQRDFIQNIQVGVLDAVIGLLTIFSISGFISRLSMMIAAFLIVRGIIRIILAYSLNLPNRRLISVAGIVSVILGILVFKQWPSHEGWFVSLCLSIEIAFRGWAAIAFALWVRKKKQSSQLQKVD